MQTKLYKIRKFGENRPNSKQDTAIWKCQSFQRNVCMVWPSGRCVGPSIRNEAIIGDGDRKRAPFLVLGLAPWYGTIFLILEQIAPSPAAHARTCCEDFCGWRAGEMASKIPEIFYAFGPQLDAFMSVGILLKYFRLKLLQFEWSKTVSNLGMSRFISLTRLCSAASFMRTSHYSTLNFIYVED